MLNKKFIKILIGVFFIYSFTIFSIVKADEIDGWNFNVDSWSYYEEGVIQKDIWIEGFENEWYCLDENGKMMMNKWTKDALNRWYYLGSNGTMQKGWIEFDGKWYYTDSKGVMQANKWIKLKGKSYYLNISGDMAVSTRTSDGYRVGADGTWDGKISINDDVVVIFKDTNLEQLVRNQINKSTGALYRSEVEEISELNGADSNIKDLSGIENLKGLLKLELYNNEISDITPLGELTNLTHIYLFNNNISDIEPLKKLSKLKSIYLFNNEIDDMSPLKELINLSYIDISNNQITDITPLEKLNNLTDFYFSDNKVFDITALKKLNNLKNVVLFHNLVSNYSIEVLKGDLPNCNIR
ncbi:hypothetical protein SH2C18_21970 [Clostridium sediminicola]|uniref:leucine-rich repeat domain-containing protein n=1 Tax=Clostridium sediminicola TaxID=3114879 RepID=UPI0031F25CF9